MSMTNYK